MASAGRCLACSHLYDSYDPFAAPSYIYSIEALLYEKKLANHGDGVCTLIELVLLDPSGGTISIRTAAADGAGDYPLESEPCTNPQDRNGFVHVRGTWDYSSIDCGEVFSMEVPSQSRMQVAIADAAGADTQAFAKTFTDTWGTANGNRGLYGVNLSLRFRLDNKSPLNPDGYGHFFILSRRSSEDAKFWGAACISGQAERGVDIIKFNVPPLPHDCCKLNSPVKVSPGSTDEHVVKGSVRLAVGGASSTPINLCLSGCDFTTPGACDE